MTPLERPTFEWGFAGPEYELEGSWSTRDCPYCGCELDLNLDGMEPFGGKWELWNTRCPRCGWYSLRALGVTEDPKTFDVTFGTQLVRDAYLRDLTNPFRRSLEQEMTSEIHRPTARGSGRRFEEVVYSVLQNNGFEVALTAATSDGGADLVVGSASGDEFTLVECKRKSDGSVGVSVVRHLVGAMIDWGTTRGWVVTNAAFSPHAVDYAERVAVHGYQIELLALDELLAQMPIGEADGASDS